MSQGDGDFGEHIVKTAFPIELVFEMTIIFSEYNDDEFFPTEVFYFQLAGICPPSLLKKVAGVPLICISHAMIMEPV